MERKSGNNFKPNYIKNQKQFLNFCYIFEIYMKFSTFKKKITCIPQILENLLPPKNVLTWMPKSSSFRMPSGSQCVHESLALPKSARHHFHPKFPLIYDNLNRISYLWIRSKMLGLFVKTLMEDNMYFPHSWEKISKQVQTQLS